MRGLAYNLMLAFLTVSASAASTLQVFVNNSPSNVVVGNQITVSVLVINNDSVQVDQISSAVNVMPASTGNLVLNSGPLPASPVSLAPSAVQYFTYIYTGQSCGEILISANANGIRSGGGAVNASEQVKAFSVLCPSPTPTPTPTATLTPWIIYETPTPPPAAAEAGVRQNVMRPGTAGAVLHYAVTQSGPVQVRIFDRNGTLIRTFNRFAAPGRYEEIWDGRQENGSPAASGIYVVHFRGVGLNTRSKIAVIK